MLHDEESNAFAKSMVIIPDGSDIVMKYNFAPYESNVPEYPGKQSLTKVNDSDKQKLTRLSMINLVRGPSSHCILI